MIINPKNTNISYCNMPKFIEFVQPVRPRDWIVGIDGGLKQSAYVIYDNINQLIIEKAIVPNKMLLNLIWGERIDGDYFVIEEIQGYGNAVGNTIFDTVKWNGRFIEALDQTDKKWFEIKRTKVKSILCHNAHAKDSNVRTEIINRMGDYKFGKTGKGTKKNPGKLYGVSRDMFAALAIAIAWGELKEENLQ